MLELTLTSSGVNVTASAITLAPSDVVESERSALLPCGLAGLIQPQGLRAAVIRPTLHYLGIDSDDAEKLLLGTLLCLASLPPSRHPSSGIGPFAISGELHTRLWDDHLAHQPDQASLLRGLASQRCFLRDPHAELGFNLAYATAMAWLIYETQGVRLGTGASIGTLARIWQLAYPHRNGRASDFVKAWMQSHPMGEVITA